MEEEELQEVVCVNDWNENVQDLPPIPPSIAEAKFRRLFAVDVAGHAGHDQYVYLVPNGLAIVGLAPSHIFLRAHHTTPTCQSAPGDAANGQTGMIGTQTADAVAEAQAAVPQQQQSIAPPVQADCGDGGVQEKDSRSTEVQDTGRKRKGDCSGREEDDKKMKLPGSSSNGAQEDGSQKLNNQQPQVAQERTEDSTSQEQVRQQPISGSGVCGAPPQLAGMQQAVVEQGHSQQKVVEQGRPQQAVVEQGHSQQEVEQHGCSQPGVQQRHFQEEVLQHGLGGTISGKGAHQQPPAAVRTTTKGLPFFPDQLVAVNFDIGKRTASQKQSGKKKSQGTSLDAQSVLCKLEGPKGTQISVRAVAPGKLLEVNQRLQQTPALLFDRPMREGYIAILFPSEAQRRMCVERLLSVEQYIQLRGLTSHDLQ